MYKLLPFFRLVQFLYDASDGGSGGASGSEPTVQQLQQQVKEIQAKFEALNQRVEKGDLVEPATVLKRVTESGEYYPKDRYAGLQQTLQKEQDAAKQLKLDMAALTATEQTLRSQVTNLEKEKSELSATVEEKDLELETLTRGKKRATIIMEKFPQLSPFEAKGLLPEGEEAELEALFGTFAEQLALVGKTAATEFGKGGGKGTPPGKTDTEISDDKKSSKDLLKAANAALRDQNVTDPRQRQANYDKLYDEYLATRLKESQI